tara:strand:+ start:178 stop:423 length:246 start_codon:yes stop_codon:yes gene_type:complete
MSSLQNAAIATGAVLAAGAGASMAVPLAMSAFGTVVSGIGTLHAAGGVAATLQSTAGACTLSNAIVAGVCSIPITYLRSKL